MYLIVGLGNPDEKYARTFHNVGYITASEVANRLNVKFKKKECESLVAEAYINGEKVIIALPLTYMNNSGRAVKQLMSKYKIPFENIVIIYDDFDLPKTKLRLRANGSAGTHNGMRSVIGEINSTDFFRIRIGINDSEVNIPIINYVLSEIKKEDYEAFNSACQKGAEAAIEFASGISVDKVMQKFN